MWAYDYDFVFDTTADGRQITCLTVVDEYTRECLTIDVAGVICSERVIDVLARWLACTVRRCSYARTTRAGVRQPNHPGAGSRTLVSPLCSTIRASLANKRVPLQLARTINEVWSMDFVSASLSVSWRLMRRFASPSCRARYSQRKEPLRAPRRFRLCSLDWVIHP